MEVVSKYVYENSDGFIICLENEKDVFTDNEGRPIILSIGMVFGTLEDMKIQVQYALENAKKYNIEKGICTIIETNHKSFRFPEYKIKKLLHFVKESYEDILQGPIHFINLPFMYRIGFHMGVSLIPEKFRKNIQIHKNNKTLLENIPEKFQLKSWGGLQIFDINLWVKNKCKDENIINYTNHAKIEEVQLKDSLLALIRANKH